MGINTHYYTVYGVKIDSYDNELSDALYETDLYRTIEQCPDFDIITDGMGCEYMVFGKILFDSGDLRWSEIKDVFTTIDLESLPDYKEAAIHEMKELLPDFAHHLDGEWKIMTFMHLS